MTGLETVLKCLLNCTPGEGGKEGGWGRERRGQGEELKKAEGSEVVKNTNSTWGVITVESGMQGVLCFIGDLG